MKRFHVAVATRDLATSVEDYTRRLGVRPDLVVPGEYALWRTDLLNLSARMVHDASPGVRHLGFEDPRAESFSEDIDVNGVVWEHFSAEDQLAEIRSLWPDDVR